jgi:ribosome modulation factor
MPDAMQPSRLNGWRRSMPDAMQPSRLNGWRHSMLESMNSSMPDDKEAVHA